MKLHELEIRHPGAGPVRHRDAVAGRHRRIGRVAVDVTGAAGRQQNRPGPRDPDRPVIRQIPDAGAAAALDDEVDDARVGMGADVRHGRDPLIQHAADFTPGRVPRVQHASYAVGPFDRQRQLAARVAIEPRAPIDQLADEPRPVLDQRLDRALVAQAVTGRKRVLCMERGRIARTDGGGDPALRMAGVPLAGLGLRQDQYIPDGTELGGGAQAGNAASDDEVIRAQVHAESDPVILVQSRTGDGTPVRRDSPDRSRPSR